MSGIIDSFFTPKQPPMGAKLTPVELVRNSRRGDTTTAVKWRKQTRALLKIDDVIGFVYLITKCIITRGGNCKYGRTET